MTVVSDSSPLITLSKIGHLDLLPQLFGAIAIPGEVFEEVVELGVGRAGSFEVASASWIEVRHLPHLPHLREITLQFTLGRGETGAILLAKELRADLILLDDSSARQAARKARLAVLGTIGVLENAFALHLLPNPAEAYRKLMDSGAYVNREILEASLLRLRLPPL